MKDTWFGISGSTMTLVLMALPCSVDCGSAGVTSCFSLTPILQGNWFPALAVLFAVLALVFQLRRALQPMVPVCLILSAAAQLLSWPLFGSLTLIGVSVICLQAAVLCQHSHRDLPAEQEV